MYVLAFFHAVVQEIDNIRDNLRGTGGEATSRIENLRAWTVWRGPQKVWANWMERCI